MTDVLLQISDPHFGTEQPRVAAALARLATALRPALYVVSGDVTQRARRHQFEAARRYFEQLPPAPRLVVPGNHDIPLWNLPARVLTPHRGFRRSFGDQTEPEHALAAAQVIGVDSSRWWRHQHGSVSAAQIARVSRHLRQVAPDRLRIVVAHHPLARADGSRRALLHRRQIAMREWAAAGADLVLGGHVHRAALVPLHERAPLPRRMWALVAGTALSHRLRDALPNSVNVVHARGGSAPGAQVERWDYAADADAFVRVASHAIEADRG